MFELYNWLFSSCLVLRINHLLFVWWSRFGENVFNDKWFSSVAWLRWISEVSQMLTCIYNVYLWPHMLLLYYSSQLIACIYFLFALSVWTIDKLLHWHMQATFNQWVFIIQFTYNAMKFDCVIKFDDLRYSIWQRYFSILQYYNHKAASLINTMHHPQRCETCDEYALLS